jgi:predicted amidophosphoribosyltransferase
MTSELRNCVQCGRLYVGGPPVCPDCRQAEAAAFERVRAYLDEHPAASIAETCEATGVASGLLHRFVEEGRLLLQPGAGATCKICGAPLTTGRLCQDCQVELQRAQERSSRGANRSSGGGIYSRRTDRQ